MEIKFVKITNQNRQFVNTYVHSYRSIMCPLATEGDYLLQESDSLPRIISQAQFQQLDGVELVEYYLHEGGVWTLASEAKSENLTLTAKEPIIVVPITSDNIRYVARYVRRKKGVLPDYFGAWFMVEKLGEPPYIIKELVFEFGDCFETYDLSPHGMLIPWTGEPVEWKLIDAPLPVDPRVEISETEEAPSWLKAAGESYLEAQTSTSVGETVDPIVTIAALKKLAKTRKKKIRKLREKIEGLEVNLHESYSYNREYKRLLEKHAPGVKLPEPKFITTSYTMPAGLSPEFIEGLQKGLQKGLQEQMECRAEDKRPLPVTPPPRTTTDSGSWNAPTGEDKIPFRDTGDHLEGKSFTERFKSVVNSFSANIKELTDSFHTEPYDAGQIEHLPFSTPHVSGGSDEWIVSPASVEDLDTLRAALEQAGQQLKEKDVLIDQYEQHEFEKDVLIKSLQTTIQALIDSKSVKIITDSTEKLKGDLALSKEANWMQEEKIKKLEVQLDEAHKEFQIVSEDRDKWFNAHKHCNPSEGSENGSLNAALQMKEKYKELCQRRFEENKTLAKLLEGATEGNIEKSIEIQKLETELDSANAHIQNLQAIIDLKNPLVDAMTQYIQQHNRTTLL